MKKDKYATQSVDELYDALNAMDGNNTAPLQHHTEPLYTEPSVEPTTNFYEAASEPKKKAAQKKDKKADKKANKKAEKKAGKKTEKSKAKTETKKQTTAKSKKKGKKKREKGEVKNFFKNIRWKQLNTTIKGYGYEYTLSKYLTQVALVLIGLIAVTYFYMLNLFNIIIVALVAISVYPVIVIAQFAYISNNNRFEQMVSYMDQMVLSFKTTPKILYAMESTLDLVDGKMKECVTEAISIIRNDTESPNVYKKAFAVIESEFKCSRLRTLHRFIETVERENSTDYQAPIDTLYFDIRSWVTRTYEYQSNLAATKRKILIILIASLAITAFFSDVLEKAEHSVGENYTIVIIDAPLYQIATTIYLILFILIYTFLNSKVNGFWLVNDLGNDKSELFEAHFAYIENFDPQKNRKNSIIAACCMLPVLAVGIILSNKTVVVLGLLLAVFMFLKGTLSYNSKKKAIERELLKEFPVWMRDIAINLSNKVVIRAVGESYDTAADILKPFLEKFLFETSKNPTDIKPYINFLGQYNVSELSTAAKTLYAIRMLPPEDAQRQINDLVVRNQTLLENSERMRHEDSIAGVSFISMLPMVLLAFKLMADLALMMGKFLGLARGAF